MGRYMGLRAGWDNRENFTFQCCDMKKWMLGAVLMASMGLVRVQAQDKSGDTTARYFIVQASIANLQEVAMSRIAVQQVVSPEVKAFAQRIVDDHSKAEAQLMQLVKTRGSQIPHEATEPPGEDMMLKNVPPKDFDRVYVHMMVPDHRRAVQLFGGYALTRKDPDGNAFAQQTLPVIKEHLAAITAIDDRMTIGTK